MPIPNNPDYDMPDDSFFKFYFLTHKNSIFTTKTNLHFGEIVTTFLNIPVEDIERICELSISLAKFSDEMYIKNEQFLTEFVRRIVELQANLPYLDRVQFSEGMDMRLCMSGMRDPENKDKLMMVDTCEFYNAHSVIRFDFFKAVQHSRVPIRCQNCGRFFLATDSYRTFYCNGKSPENPDRTCRQMGAKNKHKEKAEHNPILQTYSKARNRYYQQFYRGYLSEEDYHKIQRYLETMRDRAIRGKTDENGKLITYRMLEELFQKDTLYKKLGIGGQS